MSKEYLLKQIARDAKKEIKLLTKEHDQKIADLKKEFSVKKKEVLNDLKKKHLASLEQTRVKEENRLLLLQKQELLAKESEVINIIIEKTKSTLLKSNDFFENQLKLLKKEYPNLKEIHLPKGVTLKKRGMKADLDEFVIKGILDTNREVEIDLEQVLEEKKSRMRELMMES